MIKSVFLLAVIFALEVSILEVSGYLDIDIQTLEQLDDSKNADMSGLKIRKHNKTRKIYGNFSLNFDIGNDVLGEIKIFKKAGGEYRLQPYKIPRAPMCNTFNEDTYFYQEVAEHSSFPKQPISCPIPKGVIVFNGYYATGKNLPLMIFPSGDYAFEMAYWKENDELYRFRLYTSIINI